jgi:chaperonin GroES
MDIFTDIDADVVGDTSEVVALTLEQILKSENLAEIMDQKELDHIGQEAVDDYKLDKGSMKSWLDQMKDGIELAKLTKAEKTYPFKGAANVKYPLVTTAALQFNARAYPAIIPNDSVVRTKVHGTDRTGQKAARGDRVAAHMSWQLTSKIEEWEEETDKLLVQLPIVGTMVRKVWYDPTVQRPRCRVITPGAFIVNDKIKALGEAPRLTEEISFYPSEIESRKRAGTFRDIDYLEADGVDRMKPEDFIEQHTRLDLDGDGYDEPYIVTVQVSTGKVARVVADFDQDSIVFAPQDPAIIQMAEMAAMQGFAVPPPPMPEVISIARGSYFVPYHFLPSMDGGFFGTGLGILLGDISKTVNSIINMMMDAGHMASLGGGFIGSDMRIKGGNQRFSPGEWKLTGAKGAQIKDSIVQMTFPGPDATLFQLLGLLIDAGREVASVNDIMTGDSGGKNMTATTTLALIEQGMTVFTASYKRIFRALKAEYRLLAKINAQYVSAEEYSAFHDMVDEQGQPVMLDPAADYGAADMDIQPIADPNSVTKMQEAAKAQIIMQLAEQGMVDKGEAMTRILSAASIPDTEALAPKPDPAAEEAAHFQKQMAMMQAQMAQADVAIKQISIQETLAKIEKLRAETVTEGVDAAATAAGVELDQAKMQLEAIRDGLAGIIGQGLGRMAQSPGFGVDPFGGQGFPVGAADPMQGGLPVGPSMGGGGPVGPYQG